LNSISEIPTPALQRVLLLGLEVQNRIQDATDEHGNVSISAKLTQRIKVGVAQANNANAPIAHIEFEYLARPKADPESLPYLTATARFEALFEGNPQVSHVDWVAFTSSDHLARNLALQAAAVCQRIFKNVLRLAGIPPERINFGPIGAFGHLTNANVLSADDQGVKAGMTTAKKKGAARAKRTASQSR
jgi:hypothetical protein